MKSSEYRELIRKITKNAFKKRFPGLRSEELNQVANTVAVAIHARFYGANVDGVDSPLWREIEPLLTSSELLKRNTR